MNEGLEQRQKTDKEIMTDRQTDRLYFDVKGDNLLKDRHLLL